MIRRTTLALVTLALVAAATNARAQGASLAVGAAMPVGDLSNSSGAGYDLQFQVLTEPMLGPLALRIDIGLDHFSGKGASPSAQFSSQAVSLAGNLGPHLYWIAGPGYYQSLIKTQIAGHNVNEQKSFLGGQAAIGVNFPLIRWKGFIEGSIVKLFGPGPNQMYIPIRFGVRL